MALAQKVTITLPPGVLERLDKTCDAAGISRSGFVAKAIDAYLRQRAEAAAEARWIKSYAENPGREPAALEFFDALADEDW